jgi:hypothetical protein
MVLVQLTRAVLEATVWLGLLMLSSPVKVRAALPDFVLSCVLVAFTMMLVPLTGAVMLPDASIVPWLTVQLTADEKVPVPATVALQAIVPPAVTVLAPQLTITLLMLEVGAVLAVNRIVATANFVLSWVLVAWTVTLDPVAGAVKLPKVSIVPAVAVQVTAWEKLPDPVRVALQDVFPLTGNDVAAHETLTELTDDAGGVLTW